MRWRVVPLDNCRGDRERWPMRALIDSIFAAPAGSQPRQKTGYSDIVLAFAAVLIITLMILPLPMAVQTRRDHWPSDSAGQRQAP